MPHAHTHENIIHRRALLALGLMVAFTVTAVGLYRIAGFEPVGVEKGVVVENRFLIFADGQDGAIVILDGETQSVIDTLGSEENGFMRNVLRGFARERTRAKVGGEEPLELMRWSTGHLSLRDPSTGLEIPLSSFAQDMTAPFARLMTAGRVNS